MSWRDSTRSLADFAGELGLSHCEDLLDAASDPTSAERAAHLTEFAARSVILAAVRLVERGCRAREIVQLWDAADIDEFPNCDFSYRFCRRYSFCVITQGSTSTVLQLIGSTWTPCPRPQQTYSHLLRAGASCWWAQSRTFS